MLDYICADDNRVSELRSIDRQLRLPLKIMVDPSTESISSPAVLDIASEIDADHIEIRMQRR